MKLKSVLLGILTWSVFIIILPSLVIKLNDYLNFPAFDKNLILGYILIIFGAINFIYCSLLFSRFGKGTPAPSEPPKKLVIRGLYKYMRNPIYLGYFFIFLGEFFIFGSLLLLAYLTLIIILLNIYIIYHEEPKLKKRFGKDYINYMKKVPRWLFFLLSL